MIPQIGISTAENVKYEPYPSLTYKLTGDQIAGDIDGIDAIRQAAFGILSTERYAHVVYDNNYGVELEQYCGCDFEFLEATIEDTLRDALTQDDRIKDITVTDISMADSDSAQVVFEVHTNVGKIKGMELTVNV